MVFLFIVLLYVNFVLVCWYIFLWIFGSLLIFLIVFDFLIFVVCVLFSVLMVEYWLEILIVLILFLFVSFFFKVFGLIVFVFLELFFIIWLFNGFCFIYGVILSCFCWKGDVIDFLIGILLILLFICFCFICVCRIFWVVNLFCWGFGFLIFWGYWFKLIEELGGEIGLVLIVVRINGIFRWRGFCVGFSNFCYVFFVLIELICFLLIFIVDVSLDFFLVCGVFVEGFFIFFFVREIVFFLSCKLFYKFLLLFFVLFILLLL